MARLVPPVVTLGIYGYVSRYGGPGTLGLYWIAYNFVTIFQILANFGYDSFLMREVAKTPERARVLLTNSLALLLPYGVALAVAMPLVVRALGCPAEVVAPLWAGALALPPMAIAYALEAVLIGQERFPLILAGNAVDGVLRGVLSFLALSGHLGVPGLLLALAAGRTAAVLFYLACVAGRPGLRPLDLQPAMLAELLRGAGPFFVMYVAYAVATRLDGVLLGRFGTLADGDAYSIPNRLTLAVFLLSNSVVGTIYPSMARAAGTPALGTMVARAVRLFLLPAIPAAALLSTYPMPALRLLAGHRNAVPSAPILHALAWVIVPLMCNEPALRGLLASGGQASSMRNAFLVLAASTLLMGWGVLAAGAQGAARAFPVVVLADCLLNLQALSRRTDLSPLPRLAGPILLSGALAYAALAGLEPRLGYGAAPLFVALYVALLLATRALAWSELRRPRQLLSL